MKRREFCLLALVLTLWVPLTPLGASAAPAKPIPVSAPCGVARGDTTYRHVVWILLENEGESVVGSPAAPYLNRLGARCGVATNYFAISHPSLPNYLALTSGTTDGITDDDDPSAHRLWGPSIFAELDGDWRAYAQSMPSPCDEVTSGSYAARHNPAVYYVALHAACVRDDVALPPSPSFAAKFTFVAPNICDDMHSCPIAVGDRWLARFVPTVVRSAQYQSRSLVLVITFDEDDNDATNQVPTYVVAPTVPRGLRVDARLTHYSLLRTTEQLLGLKLLGAAASAKPMSALFHL